MTPFSMLFLCLFSSPSLPPYFHSSLYKSSLSHLSFLFFSPFLHYSSLCHSFIPYSIYLSCSLTKSFFIILTLPLLSIFHYFLPTFLPLSPFPSLSLLLPFLLRLNNIAHRKQPITNKSAAVLSLIRSLLPNIVRIAVKCSSSVVWS